ncbi:DNA polymerase subunit gamma-1 [Blattella germanica]|nr:DNA polymerase subunit gamma-1 [Blattella germanica]
MILNSASPLKSRLLVGCVKYTPQKYAYSGEGSQKICNEKTKKKIGLSEMEVGNQSITSEESNIAALKSLHMAISECIPHTVKIVCKDSKKTIPNIRSVNEKVNGHLPNDKSSSTPNKYKKLSHSSMSLKAKGILKPPKTESSIKLKTEKESSQRLNEVNIQMLPEGLFQHLFRNECSKKPSEDQVSLAREALEKHGLLTNDKVPEENISLKLPPLEGGTLQSHFQAIGEHQSRPYRILLNDMVKDLPEMPKEWCYQPGWTKYCNDQPPQSVPFPEDDALVFDVEVCRSAGEMPTLATAVSANAWYSWVSNTVFNGSGGALGRYYSMRDLIPLESGLSQRGIGHKINKPKLVVGHNVSYDRARIKEQYWLEGTGMRFIDTMSLHVCISGVTSYQRALLKSATTKTSSKSQEEENKEDEEWRNCSSLNSLSEVHKLYCGTELNKTTRDVFINGTLEDVSKQFQTVMQYCAKDVSATHNVLQRLWPLFLARFPHPVTLAGILELSTAYLPVNSNWNRYLADADQTFEDYDNEARFLLARRADKACQMLHNDAYREDVWMWDQDWTTQELKLKKNSTKIKIEQEHRKMESENSDNTVTEKIKANKISVAQEVNRNEEKETKKLEEIIDNCEETDDEDKLNEKFEYLMETKNLLPAKIPHLPGYPAWYRKLCPRPSSSEWTPGAQLISTSMQITPKLLCLTWESYPLHFIRGHGWGFLVPYCTSTPNSSSLNNSSSPHFPLEQLLKLCPIPKDSNLMAGCNESESVLCNLHQTVEQNISRKAYAKKTMPDQVPSWYTGSGVWCNVDVGNCCWFLKLPHKDGSNRRVGNPLAKDFLNKFSENVLAGRDAGAEKLLSIGRMLSYWRNNKERIVQQLVVWLDDRDLPRDLRNSDSDFGAIIPQVVVCGTLTRRAVEPTWMTASNAHKERIGSELRAMVQAPPGYSIVGADVDSQELWIASMIGDAYFARIHGATPFGWMTLSGRKADGTDMHSVTAKAVGISRDHAKVINYARIYGAGQQFAERLLKQFNPAMSDVEARAKASKMFALTKGKRKFRLKSSYCSFLEDRDYTMYEALKLRAKHGVSLEEMFEHPHWTGGTESAMFNRLEEIANSKAPATPFLGGQLSRALQPKEGSDDRYLPTRINWVVQSGAVDFLHLMLVSMRWLLDSRARFCISFHDEVRYLVPDEQKYQTALALHMTNLLVRAFCASQLGLTDLPLSVAFFTSVEVDTVLRKEAHHECSTPSNPHGLSKGYGIPQGESLDIHQSLQKAGGSLKAANRKTKKRMSKATKRKHVIKEVLLDDLELPTDNQEVVKVLASRGNNLHEVEGATGSQFLVSMPTKFRRNVWIKRGDFVLVEPIPEGDKVKAEIVKILTSEHTKFFQENKRWPEQFLEKKECDTESDLFVNTNRLHQYCDTATSSSDNSEESNSDDSDDDTDTQDV